MDGRNEEWVMLLLVSATCALVAHLLVHRFRDAVLWTVLVAPLLFVVIATIHSGLDPLALVAALMAAAVAAVVSVVVGAIVHWVRSIPPDAD